MKMQSWHATATPTPASKGCHMQQVPGSGIWTGDKGPPQGAAKQGQAEAGHNRMPLQTAALLSAGEWKGEVR